ncbi:MAG: AAA family ATPase [Oscillospiraceae bacterium]
MHSYLKKYIEFRNSIKTDYEVNKKIKNIIALYKDDFIRINKEERFKWEAINTYKKVWDIDSDNFASMIESAFRDHGALLKAGNYYPYKMLVTFAEAEPETVRSLFKTLYDENLDLNARISAFKEGFNNFYKPQNLNSYQDLHAISVYLTFEYPEKYYIYQYRVLKNFVKAISYNSGNIDSMFDTEKYSLLSDVCDRVLELLDDEVKEISMERLDENCYADGAFHILAHDIIYFGSQDAFPESNNNLSIKEEKKMNISKNTILYGPPGTGKTYNTVLYAVAIIENKNLSTIKAEEYNDVLSRYNKYKNEGLIEFTTFHQSYGYEEFIEGIKPIKNDETDDDGNIQYDILPGLFKRFCERANTPTIKQQKKDIGLNNNPSVWKVSLEKTGDNPTRRECLNNGHIRIGWDEYGPDITDDTNNNCGKIVLNSFINKMKIGDIVFSCYSNTTIDAIGIITGDYEWTGNKYDYYNRIRKVDWIVKDIRENIVDINGGSAMTLSTVYKLKVSLDDAISLIEKHLPSTAQIEEKQNYVFIIDEINRGNISKIFGELITLIEPTKRIGQTEGMKIRLPYSQTMFGVPDNVYILGTMNTADRSIAAIDTALRRRFRFKEIMPDVNVLDGITVEGVIIKNMLDKINKRIMVLYDREHTIGHSYFLPLKDNPTLDTLAVIFSDDIIPLLQEYFYEDYEKIRLVLGDNKKSVDDTNRFIIAVKNDYNELFGNTEGFDDSFSYEINNEAFYNIEAYRKI